MFAKISLSFTILLIMSIITGVFSCLHVNSMNEIANNYVDVSIPATVDLWTARRAIQATEKYALETVLAVDQAELDEIEANLLEERT